MFSYINKKKTNDVLQTYFYNLTQHINNNERFSIGMPVLPRALIGVGLYTI